MRRAAIWAGVAIGSVVVAAAASRSGAGELLQDRPRSFTVTLRATEPRRLGAGDGLRVLRRGRDGSLTVVPGASATFDFDGSAAVSVPADTYVFEVVNSSFAAPLLAVRTTPQAVSSDVTVTLDTSAARRLRVTLDGRPVTVDGVGVRRSGAGGEEVGWSRSTADQPSPDVVVTPGQTYAAHVFANGVTPAGPVCVAIWRPIAVPAQRAATGPSTAGDQDEPPPLDVALRSSEGRATAFGIRPGTPPLRGATVRFGFATGWLPVDLPLKANRTAERLLTNRAFAVVEYDLATVAGPTLAFDRMAYDLSRTARLDLGGPLRASAWAADVWRDDNKTFLCWGASLSDAGGHELSFDRSNAVAPDGSGASPPPTADVRAVAQLDGGAWTDQSPMPGVDGAAVKDPDRRVAVRLSYTDGTPPARAGASGRTAVVLRAAPLSVVRDARYELRVPPAWRYRGAMYLAKLERMHAVELGVTHRPGPGRVRVDWRLNSNNAVASVGNPRGGDQGLWMSMPFSGLDLVDPFDAPPMLDHEMLHNFGYNHGPEMAARQAEAAAGFAAVRGEAADRPAWLPPNGP